MPPTTRSTLSTSISFAVLALAALSAVSPSSMMTFTGRPSRPPLALISSTSMVVRFALAMPMKDNGPVSSAIRPILMGFWSISCLRSLGFVGAPPPVAGGAKGTSGLIVAEQHRRLRLAHVAGLLQDRRHFGVRYEVLPTL